MGIVTLRQREGVNWVRIEHTPTPQEMSAGEWVLGAMRTGDFLETVSTDEEFLDHYFRAAECLEWNRKHALTDEGLETKEGRLKLTGGLPFEGSVAGVLIRLLYAADGERRLREVIEELAAAGHLADWPEVAPEFLVTVRKLILGGFLTPVDTPTPKLASVMPSAPEAVT